MTAILSFLCVAVFAPVAIAIVWSVLLAVSRPYLSRPWFYLCAAAASAVIPPLIGYLAAASASTSDEFHSADPFAGFFIFMGLANGILGIITALVLWFMRPKTRRAQRRLAVPVGHD